MSDGERSKLDPLAHIVHEASLAVAEGILNGLVTPADVAYVDTVFGSLAHYEEAPESDIDAVKEPEDIRMSRALIDSAFPDERSLAPGYLRTLLGSKPENLKETTSSLRAAYLDIANAHDDSRLLAWAFEASDRTILNETLRHAEMKQAEEDI